MYNQLIDASLSTIASKVETYADDNSRSHKKCDYIELLALLSSDELYKDDFLSRFYRESSDRCEDSENEQASIDDGHQQELVNLFEILQYRSQLYAEDYPFDVNSEMIKLKENISTKQKLYIILLSCANLTTFEKSLQYHLADEFEHITYCAIRQYLPSSFQVKKLGSNSDYTGNTRKKLNDLGRDINLPTEDEQINAISIRANKEKGVDLVAWHSFIDNLPNTIILLIQCACGRDTLHKMYEPAAYMTYFNFSKFQKQPIISLATPKSVVIKSNFIKQMSEVAMGDILFFDRLRLMELIKNEKCVSSIEAFNLADRLVSETISVLD
jgi:hypothetical protein